MHFLRHSWASLVWAILGLSGISASGPAILLQVRADELPASEPFTADENSAESGNDGPVTPVAAETTVAAETPVAVEPIESRPQPNPSPLSQVGKRIYESSCADCHGSNGQGVAGAYERALTGDLSVGQLAKIIADTMPEGEPQDCVGEDAQAVADYLHHAFYSEAAQVRNRPPRLLLTRLTAEQTRQSLADLYASFDWIPRIEAGQGNIVNQGLTGDYFKGSNRSKENKVLERIDPVIDFDFGKESPGLEIPAEDFAIHWRGGLSVKSSGNYEIIVRSTCSFTCNLGHHDRVFIDNHVQSGDRTEFRREIYLTAGRNYPFFLTFIQRKRITELPPATVSVSWIPPGGVEQVIPPENWVPGWMPPAFSLQATLPPDDRSYGYQRGISVDRDWDDALTAAALELGNVAVEELWPAYQRRHRERQVESRQLLNEFLREVLTVAFRYQMDDDLQSIFIDQQLGREEDDAQAIKRVLLLGLKSPRFLYPYLDAHRSDSAKAGTRLALTLLDSLPVDAVLKKAMDDDELQTEDQIRSVAYHLLGDYRLRAKTRSMLHYWLDVEQPKDSSKPAELFPGFDRELLSELKASFDQFLDSVVWGQSSDYRQFFQADWSFTSDRIERYYGPEWSPDPQVETADELENADDSDNNPTDIAGSNPVGAAGQIPSPSYSGLHRTGSHAQRVGLLTHPYLMSRLAYHDTTSPIHRGVFLLRYVLGRTLQPPQEAFTPLSPDLHPDMTTRQRVELQTSPANCQACHQQINHLGFALENWDAVGRFRLEERNQPIDSAGRYVNRDGDEVQFEGAGGLADYLLISRDAHQSFVRRAFHHFVQQPPAAFGANTLDRLTDRFIQNDFNVRELLVDIAVTAAMTPAE